MGGPLTWVDRCAFTKVNGILGVVYLGGEVERQAIHQGGPVGGCGPADGVVDPFSGQLTHPAPLSVGDQWCTAASTLECCPGWWSHLHSRQGLTGIGTKRLVPASSRQLKTEAACVCPSASVGVSKDPNVLSLNTPPLTRVTLFISFPGSRALSVQLGWLVPLCFCCVPPERDVEVLSVGTSVDPPSSLYLFISSVFSFFKNILFRVYHCYP